MKHFLASILLTLAVLTAPLAHAGSALLLGAGGGGSAPAAPVLNFQGLITDSSFANPLTLTFTLNAPIATGDAIAVPISYDSNATGITSVVVSGQNLPISTPPIVGSGGAAVFTGTASAPITGTASVVITFSGGCDSGATLYSMKNLTSNTPITPSLALTTNSLTPFSVMSGGFLLATNFTNSDGYTSSTVPPTNFRPGVSPYTSVQFADWSIAANNSSFAVVPEGIFSHPTAGMSFR